MNKNKDKEIMEKRVSPKKILQDIARRERANKRPYAPKSKTKDKKDRSTDIEQTKTQPKYDQDSEKQSESIKKPKTNRIEPEKDFDVAKTTLQVETQQSDAINKGTETGHLNRDSLLGKEEKTIVTDYLSTIREIERTEYNHIDGRVLLRLVRLVYHLALKKSEVINLKIQDVIDKAGSVAERIQVGSSKVPLLDNVKDLIREEIDDLRNMKGYRTQKDAPLFQMKDGSKYAEVARHLKKYTKLTLNKIQQAGIIDYFSFLLSENIGINECEKRTAAFARLSVREVRGIITGQIPPAGRIKEVYERDSYMDEIIECLQKIDKVQLGELIAIPEKLADFDIYNLDKVEKLRDVYFEAVEKNQELNKKESSEVKKENSKSILNNSLIEAFKEKGITFDPATGKPRLELDHEPDPDPGQGPPILSDIIKGM